MDLQSLADILIGEWEGQSQLWLDPSKPPESTAVTGQFEWVFGERILRHRYQGTAAGKPHHGEETYVDNQFQGRLELYWSDSFHMNYAVMKSVGQWTEKGYDVKGGYEVGKDMAPWGWRTTLEVIAQDHVQQTAYNISPAGEEDLAVRVDYRK